MRVKRKPQVGRTGARFPRHVPTDEPGGAGSVTASEPDIDEVTVAADATAVALPQRRGRPAVGVTGARFIRQSRSSESTRQGTEPERPPVPAPGRSPIRPGQRSPADPAPTAAPSPLADPVDAATTSTGGAATVRPYVLTRGRTRPPVAFPLEAMVTTGSSGRSGTGAMGATLMELCLVPRSVAEVAALAGIPLGVARVIIGDLAMTGALVVHETAGHGGPDLALLQRVLTGLKTL